MSGGRCRSASCGLDAVFIEAGAVPVEEFAGGLVEVNEAGEIEVVAIS